MVSKELQYGYSKGTSPAECEIFFFLFFGISGTGSPPPAVLLHSCRPLYRTGGISLRVQKSPSGFPVRTFLHSTLCQKTGLSGGKV